MVRLEDMASFMRGAEEIDRKRKTIARIMGFLEGCVKDGWPIVRFENDSELKFSAGILSVYKEFRLSLFIFGAGNIVWSADGSHISVLSVSIVYEKIPEIIMCLQDAFPELKIIERFNFFVNLVPSK